MGNDYLITFNNDNSIASRKQLHKNIISTNYGKADNGEEIIGAVHTHLPETGEFITATDNGKQKNHLQNEGDCFKYCC